ncbi:MAG: DedA family protein [Candidatus Thorarchaeota archaeon]
MQDIFQFMINMISEGYIGLFIICFIINMIPFFSPSNMVLAGVAAIALGAIIPWPVVGFIVAVAATIAKLIHYYVVRGSRVVLSSERRQAIDRERARVEKWGALALLIAAASPVPDDPLIVYVGLTRYSVPKFLVSYFVGKVAITLAGALIGSQISNLLEPMPIVLASLVLTVVIIGVLFKRKTEGEESDMLQDILIETVRENEQDNDASKDPSPHDHDSI